MKRYLAALGWALGMLVLILDGRTAMAGASEGLELCMKTLIPNLFPFFVLSSMLTGCLSGGGLVLTGILGGYPLGAGSAHQAYRSGQLTRDEAGRMAVICNCAGPSFLFGVVGPVLGRPGSVFALWGIYLLSILAVAMLLPGSHSIRGVGRPVKLQQALSVSIRAMAGVCGWVILFRVMLAVLDRWVLWLLPDWGRTVAYGILELSNGCLALESLDPGLRFVLAGGFISFGGLCVLLQTASVMPELPMALYFPGKCFQASVSMLLASLAVPGAVSPALQGIFLLLGIIFGVIIRKTEKRCGNRRPVIV